MANISKVYLITTPLEDDMKNTLYFANESAQRTYFEGLIPTGRTYTDVSYQSSSKTFRCPNQVDVVRKYNYIMWQNPAYSNKWFYGFIKKSTYVSDSYTDVEFEVDPLQTFMFDISVQPSFVEREHTNNDTAGNNTLPENVELGPYVKNSVTGTSQWGASTMWYCVAVSDLLKRNGVSYTVEPASRINGIPNGLFYLFTDSTTYVHNIVDIYDAASKANAIYSIFIFPKQLLYVRQGDTGSWAYTESTMSYNVGVSPSLVGSMNIKVPTSNNLVGTINENLTISKPTRVGMSYEPRNKKLLTFPYCYFNISNNSGTTVTYHYEDFGGNPKFNHVGVLTPGCATKLYPTNYKNMTIFSGDIQDNPYDYGVTGGKFPTISWNSDSYTNWLTQNAVNIAIGAGSSLIATGASLATGNVAGAASSFLGGVTSAVSQFYQANLLPDQAKGNTNVGDLNYTAHANKFTVFELSIKPQYAQIIDDYFDLFGYKTCRVKTPYVAHRQNWWYTKTINANIIGHVPNDEMNKIKEAYNNGLTFWRNPANFLNYSVSNGIV